MPLVLKMPGFWIYQNSKHARVLNIHLVINMLPILRVLTMTENAWIISKYSEMNMNMPKSAWMTFILYVPIVIPRPPERVVTYFNKVYSFKEHEVVSLKRQNLIFSIVAESTGFVFCFRLNTFTSKI